MDYFKDILSGVLTFRIPEIRIQDIIDILIVSWLIYKIMMWIRRTRAWSISKGVVFILLAFLAANYFGLYTVKWIIINSISMGITAIIVLFQPEIRKVLEGIGSNKLIPYFGVEEEDDNSALNEIVTAVYEMSRQKTGALILIERNVGLADHEKTGIPIDALVTSQLLINIFEDKTPLHDGAVIIRNSRIIAATCILPLTQSEIGHELGTRHRAALGASEVSDADVIVVSEETGAVSLARASKLYRNLPEKKLLEMLEKSKSDKKKAFWRGWQGIEKNK